MTDDELASLFDRVVADLDPAVDAIVGQAERLGRRRRARRKACLAAGNAVAVVAVAGVAIAIGAQHGHSPASSAVSSAGSAPGTAGHRSPAGHASPAPGGTASRVHSAPPGGVWPVGASPGSARVRQKHPTASPGQGSGAMTRRELLRTLRRLLPAHSQVSHVTHPWPGALEVDYNDGRGAVDLILAVSATVTYPALNCPDPLWTDEGTRPAGALPISCVMRTLADGSKERDAVMYADEFGFYGYGIYDERPDGVTVFIQVGNGINHTLPQVDRARPPGSMAEWAAIAESPAWHL
jgi:hypothetical protein